MGDLEFRGLDNGLTAKLRNAWKIRPGEIYNSTYLSEYLPAAQRLLPPTLDWEVSPHVTPNVRDKTVDVDLIYTAKAPSSPAPACSYFGTKLFPMLGACRKHATLTTLTLASSLILPGPSPIGPGIISGVRACASRVLELNTCNLRRQWGIFCVDGILLKGSCGSPHGSRDQARQLKKENVDECSKHEN